MKSITIGHLYPKEMNIYGDFGNLLVLQRRLEWRGYTVKTKPYYTGEKQLDLRGTDILIGGGGQDSGQVSVEKDLRRHKQELSDASDSGMPMLMICGMYQLFGHEFVTLDGQRLEGIGIFDLTTSGDLRRMIGNVVIDTAFGPIVGFENHSGKTTLSKNTQPFGAVMQGSGNNGEDKTEGAQVGNSIGTYLHGPLLPKNPVLADYLIQCAVNRRYGVTELTTIDDGLEQQAYKIARRLEY